MRVAEQRKSAKIFFEYWKDRGYEKGESQPFWLELLQNVLGIENPARFISFEDKIRIDHTSFIDGFISATNTLIEQKGRGRDLRKAIRQSDGSLLTPFQQAQRYSAALQQFPLVQSHSRAESENRADRTGYSGRKSLISRLLSCRLV